MKLNHRLKADAVCSEGIKQKYINVFNFQKKKEKQQINIQFNQKME